MTDFLASIERSPGEPFQAGFRRVIVAAAGDGRLKPGERMPTSRILSRKLGVARNTIAAAYEDLIERGVLVSIARRGVFVSDRVAPQEEERTPPSVRVNWANHLKISPTSQRNISRPTDWQTYPYPFVYGQVDPTLFPLADWRACSRDALARASVNWWSADRVTLDDPLLIEQIRRHILPKRGLHARDDEILITLGSQHALYLLARLLVNKTSVVGVEDPGYPDVRNIIGLTGGTIRLVPVDEEGIVVGPELAPVDLVFVSPNHQSPTMVTMSDARRRRLLEWARARDAIVIEDDYESELPSKGRQAPALASRDQGRVLYLGTFSKILAPGMRLGFMVAPADVIAEARALRRLMSRNVPLNNQRTAALFIAEGHYDRLVRRLGTAIEERRVELKAALARHLPDFKLGAAIGGTCIWLRCPEGVSGTDLAIALRDHGVIVERGDFFFADPTQGSPYIRIGLSTIPVERIEEGVARIARVAKALAAKTLS